MTEEPVKDNAKQPIWFAVAVTVVCAASMLNMVLMQGSTEWVIGGTALGLALSVLLILVSRKIQKNNL